MVVRDVSRLRRDAALEAVLGGHLIRGAQWHMLPESSPNDKLVHRPFQSWCHSEVFGQALTDVVDVLCDMGVLDWEECFIDATFAMAKGGGAEIGPTKRGKGLKTNGDCGSTWLAALDQHPDAVYDYEVRLVQLMLLLLHDRGQAGEPYRRPRL